MPVYNKVYRGQFSNLEVDPETNQSRDVIIVVDIYDTSSGEAVTPTQIIPLEMTDTPVRFESIDNDENKDTIIRSVSAEIKIYTSDSIGIETFYAGGDTRFYVEIYTPGEYYFIKGFLSTADLQEDFLPDPNILTLTATDGFGFLADEELRDEDGNIPTGVHNVWYYIRLALLKTNQSFGAFVVFNIREKFALTLNTVDSNPGHFFKYCYLDAKTFEGENVGTMISCLEVLKRILYGCFITQYNGKWLIVNVDEMQFDTSYNFTLIDEDGNFSNNASNNFIKFIGAGSPLSWMDDDALVSCERPYKTVKNKFLFELPSELICNYNFERGDFIANGDDITIEDITYNTKKYSIECWEYAVHKSKGQLSETAPGTAYIKKLFFNDREVQRYVEINVPSHPPGVFHKPSIKSEPVFVNQQDKLNVSLNSKWNVSFDSTSNITATIGIEIVGDDGSYWYLHSSGFWFEYLPGNDYILPISNHVPADGNDFTEWQSNSFSAKPIPVSGLMYTYLFYYDGGDATITDHTDLNIDLIFLINGSYGNITGQEHSVTQADNPENYKAIREQQIYVSDAPRKVIKGALQKRGEDREIFSGTVSFGTAGQFELSGDHRAEFAPYIGKTIIISGSSSNNQEATLLSLNYSLIGNTTQVFTSGTTVTEIDVPIVVKVAIFVLAELFYNAIVLPDGPFEDAQSKPYGENLAFNIWNQYNRVMVKFEGNIDGLQTDSDSPPHFIHKYVLTDANPNTGTRAFMLLHFSQDLYLCAWEIMLHEVHDPSRGKQYLNHNFKYLTQ